MAQYRFSAQVIGRSSGRSSVAAAAYRAGVSLADERTGLVHDFSRRHGILHTEIMAPDNAPAWMRDRAQLWNAVEKAETRINSQLAREVQLSLPHELDGAQRLALVQGFVRDQFVSRGMIADLAIHAPGRDGDDRNHHAHIMLTMRELTGEGFHKSKATPAAREWNAKENIEQWREAWGDYQNRTFRSLGLDIAVDHRSLFAQGVDREATFHLGPSANDMERRGKPSRIVEQNRAIDGRNEERNTADRAAVVVNLEVERLKRAEAKTLYDRQTALQSAQALTMLDLERRQHLDALRLSVDLQATYGDQKRSLAASAAAIDSRLQTTGFRKLIRNVSGRSERDRKQLDGITRTLSHLETREKDATASMQKQHVAEREALKVAQAKLQEATARRIVIEFERKRRDELRSRRDAQAVEKARQSKQEQVYQKRPRFNAPPQSRARPKAETARSKLAPIPATEKTPVKREFDLAAELEKALAVKTETERKFVRTPAPQPTPRGDVIVPRREAVDVPKATPARMEPPKRETPPPLRTAAPEAYRAPAPAQPPAPAPLPAKDWNAKPEQAVPTAQKDWNAKPEPATPTAQKDWNAATVTPEASLPRKDWNAAAIDRPLEIKPLPTKDRDFDRDR